MVKLRAVTFVAVVILALGIASVTFAMKERAMPIEPPDYAVGRLPISGPFVILQQGDTTWVQIYTDNTSCPGDTLGGHGGEATGGPEGKETWCFEGADSCGDFNLCFTHEDVRALPSQVGTNYWHIDTYLGVNSPPAYIGNYALWCGSDSIWQGQPVECGIWVNPPGYGDRWNCIAQLTLPDSFTIANGCSLMFDPRYDTECKYDYFYVDYWNGSEWVMIAMFNATSNNPGDECGSPTGGNPDYWGFTDTNRFANCNFVNRGITGVPAFHVFLDDTLFSYTTGPRFRWRFVSDGAWSDADGRGDTDGAAWIDNVTVVCDGGMTFFDDFETGTVDMSVWSFPDPEGVIDQWHIVHDPEPPYEGDEPNQQRSTCTVDSSFAYRARPENGYPVGVAWRNQWYYRLLTPKLPTPQTGCVVQYDQYMCCPELTCDYTDTKVRFYDSSYGMWCPWINIDGFILYGGCFFWNFDDQEDVTPFYGETVDSMQFAFELMDISNVGDFCYGKHKQAGVGKTDNIIDNVSIGFFDGNASRFSARVIDIFQDTFFQGLCAYNSFFDAYDPDTVAEYSGTNTLPSDYQLRVTVTDKDNLTAVELWGSIDGGATWVSKTMTLDLPSDPSNPALGGEYYGTLCPGDFSLTEWAKGTEVWYYVKATDALSNEEYFPARANPNDPDHTGTSRDYFTFSIFPLYPDTYEGVKVLLVDGYGRRNYDYSPCLSDLENIMPLEDIYENTLRDAGYCYDKFDISGAGSNIHIHPTQYDDYDVVVWFCGPYFSNYLFDKEAQEAIETYLGNGGKFVICGDRVAYCMSPDGANEDSLGGRFLTGILGADYLGEMDEPFAKPYLYMEGVSSVDVFGSPVSLDFDTLLVYRECPYLKDMSWVVTTSSPPGGYYPQPLLTVLNPDVSAADGAIYTEYLGVGQCVFVNFDLCGVVNHTKTYCSGSTPDPAPDFNPGAYEGRVELMRMILEDIFGLPSSGTGKGGTASVEPPVRYKWALAQNTPNPCVNSTRISFELARDARVSIKIYNAMGQLVRTLVDDHREAGRYSVTWDGTNAQGQRVSSGVYFYKMEAGNFVATKKMLVLK